jgi:hypothetical protein
MRFYFLHHERAVELLKEAKGVVRLVVRYTPRVLEEIEARFDKQKFEIFEKLTEKQLSFFWRPEEIDVTKDKIDFNKLPIYRSTIQLLFDG